MENVGHPLSVCFDNYSKTDKVHYFYQLLLTSYNCYLAIKLVSEYNYSLSNMFLNSIILSTALQHEEPIRLHESYFIGR